MNIHQYILLIVMCGFICLPFGMMGFLIARGVLQGQKERTWRKDNPKPPVPVGSEKVEALARLLCMADGHDPHAPFGQNGEIGWKNYTGKAIHHIIAHDFLSKVEEKALLPLPEHEPPASAIIAGIQRIKTSAPRPPFRPKTFAALQAAQKSDGDGTSK